MLLLRRLLLPRGPVNNYLSFTQTSTLTTTTAAAAATATTTITEIKKRNTTKYDWIGPADPHSNLKRMIFRESSGKEGPITTRYKALRIENERLNHQFWSLHNHKFHQGKSEFLTELLAEKYPNEPDKTTIKADEMSVFYKRFLNETKSSHLHYNLQWQKRNWKLIFYAVLANIESRFI